MTCDLRWIRVRRIDAVGCLYDNLIHQYLPITMALVRGLDKNVDKSIET